MRSIPVPVLLVLVAATASADPKYDPAPELDGDRPAATALMYRLNQLAMGCDDGTVRGRVVVEATLDAGGKVTSVTTEPETKALTACFASALRVGKFPTSTAGASVRRPFVFAGCSAFALEDRGDRQFDTGQYASALRSYEASFACDSGLVQHEVEHSKAFLAACHAKNTAKAKHYYRLLPGPQRVSLEPWCTQNGVPSLAPSAGNARGGAPLGGCHRAKMLAVAESLVKAGKRADAVRQFSDTLRCGVQRDIVVRATEVACEAKSVIYAKMFYAMLDPSDRATATTECSKLGVTLP